MQKFISNRAEAKLLLQMHGLDDLIADLGIIQENESFDISDAFIIEGDGTKKTARRVAANRCTLYRVLLHLRGRRELLAELKPGTTLDQVTVLSIGPDTCDCELSMMLHRTEKYLAPIPLHSVRKCKAHGHLKGAHEDQSREHHDAVMSENNAKNACVDAILQVVGGNPDQVNWEFAEDRSLKISHPDLVGEIGTKRRADLLAKLKAIGGKRSIILE